MPFSDREFMGSPSPHISKPMPSIRPWPTLFTTESIIGILKINSYIYFVVIIETTGQSAEDLTQ